MVRPIINGWVLIDGQWSLLVLGQTRIEFREIARTNLTLGLMIFRDDSHSSVKTVVFVICCCHSASYSAAAATVDTIAVRRHFNAPASS